MVTAVLEKVTFYINPETFKAEQEFIKTGRVAGQNINMDFKRHQESAKETGIPELRPDMKEMLDRFYKEKRYSKPSADTVYLTGPDGEEVHPPKEKPPEDSLGD